GGPVSDSGAGDDVTDRRNLPMLCCLSAYCCSSVKCSTAPCGSVTGWVNSKTAACGLLTCGISAQPVPGLLSMAFATSKPLCEKVACGRCRASGLGGAEFPAAWAATWNSLRTRLPLGARPGPCAGRLGSVSTSRRTPVTPASLALAVTL